MKIKRTPIKTLPTLVRYTSIDCCESLPYRLLQPPELAKTISCLLSDEPIAQHTTKEWNYQKSDFFQFVTVLNHFDELLESLCKKYELSEKIQTKQFDKSDKETLLSILNFTRLLFDNCSNRNLYNSYEHLNSLFYTTDIDVLEATLALLLKPAQRMNNPTAAQSNFSIKKDTVITELAKNGDITFFASNDAQNETKISASFYKEEGGELEVIDIAISGKPDQEIFWETVNKHQIASEYHFELLNKIRLANHNNSINARRQLLKIRLMSIVILAHVMPGIATQNRLYIYEPNLIPQIVQLLSSDNHVSIDIQTYALYALDAIARHKSKQTEVLNSLNTAANHGILLHILRQFPNNSTCPQAFIDAFFTLISFLVDTVAGSQMLSSAGILNACVHLIENKHTKPYVLTKVFSILDIFFDSSESAYTNFFHINGLSASVSSLKTQVDICTKNSQHHNSIVLVKAILRFIIRMIKSSEVGSSLRNLMETSIPSTLIVIMNHHSTVGSTVFGLALSLYASYTHMEPVSLTSLQEMQVPQTFLKAFAAYQGYCDVTLLLNVLSAFSATCLNDQGLDMFREAQPLPHFFKLMTSHHFLKNPVEVAEAGAIGGEMSELIRHQPALKLQTFTCIHSMLHQVIEVGNTSAPEDGSHLLAYDIVPARAKIENNLLSLIEMSARFLDGFLEFENSGEFIGYLGHEILLEYYSLPMLPFDYHLSGAFAALSGVFQSLADRQTVLIVECIIAGVRKSVATVVKSEPSPKCSLVDYIYVDGTNEDLLNKGNKVFREYSFLMGRIGLLSNVLSSFVFQKDETCDDFMEWLYKQQKLNEKNPEHSFFALLGSIHRSLIWETILLRNEIPRSWYTKKTVMKKDGSTEEIEEADLTDPKVANARRFSELLSGASPMIMLLFQSVIKLEPYMNRNPSEEEGRKWFMVSRAISVEILKNFQWMPKTIENCEDYISAVSALFSMLILEDSGRRHLVSLVAVWFGAIGGIRWVVDNLTTPYSKETANMIGNNETNTRAFEKANRCLELLYPVLHHLVMPNLYSEEVLRRIADCDKKLEVLHSENWLIFVRADVLRIKAILSEPSFPHLPKNTIQAVLGCVKQCMYMDGEKVNKPKVDLSPGISFNEKNFLENLVTSIKDTVSPTSIDRPRSPTPSQDVSNIPEDDNDEDYEDYEESSELGVSVMFVGVSVRLLDSSRYEIRNSLPEVLIHLAQDREDLDFAIRDTLIALICGDPDRSPENSKLMFKIFEDMTASIHDLHRNFGSFMSRMRIFALMLREQQVQEFVGRWVSALFEWLNWSELLEIILTKSKHSKALSYDQKWLPTFFFILETWIAQAENYPPGHTDHMSYPTSALIMERCILLLEADELTEDSLLSALRILVRLTKLPELANDFLKRKGLEAIFRRPRNRFDDSIRAQQAYVIIIMRHLMENKEVISVLMKEWLTFCSRKYRSKEFPLEKKIKMAQPLFLRHPTAFINLVEHISTKDKFLYHTEKEYIAAVEDSHVKSKTVVHFLLNQLVRTQAIKKENDHKLGYTGYIIECLLELVASYPNCKEDIISFEIPSDIEFHYTQDMVPQSHASILHVLLNILVPYGPLNAVTDIERKRKGIYVWTIGLFVSLCYDTAYSGNMKPKDNQDSDNESDSSSWQDKPGAQGPRDNNRAEVLTTVRTRVMQAIAEFLSYFTKSNTKSTAKYIKYYTLAELCHYIINSRQADINPHYMVSYILKEKNTKDLSKLMIDNEFVPLFISAIQDVNVNYPNAKAILNSLLRPLETVVKMATRFEEQRPYDREKEKELREKYYSVVDQEMENTPLEEIETLYRNSSMAILDGTAVEEELEQSTGFSSDDEEINMASSGEEILDDEDQEVDSDNEMVIDVEPEEDEEDDADREMNELMRNHRHHLPDTDEEGSSSSEESSESFEDGSSDSFDEENNSDVYNSDMSDQIESDIEDEWHPYSEEIERPNEGDLFTNDEGETEDEEMVNGPQGYNIAVRRHAADGSMNSLVVSSRSNATHMPSMSVPLRVNNRIRYRTEDPSHTGDINSGRDDIVLHPLLQNFSDDTKVDFSEPQAESISTSYLQPYEDVIGHDALFMLRSAVYTNNAAVVEENVFDQDVSGATLDTLIPQKNQVLETIEETKESKNVLHLLLDFSPVPTIERWKQVTQMAFISRTAESIVKAMADNLPKIYDDDTNEENKNLLEDVQYRHMNCEDEHIDRSEQNRNSLDNQPRENNSINVSFRGQEVEVQRQDIGPQFLDALPEDFRTQILSAQDNENEDVLLEVPFDGLDPDFLAVLPNDVREELVRQEETLSHRRRLESEEPGMQNQSPSNSQSNEELDQTHIDNTSVTIEESDSEQSETEELENAKDVQFLDVIRIISRSELAVLARLLFVPQSIVKVLLNRILLNLCENTSTCDDLLSLLLFVLQDECSDLSAVDRSFFRMLNQNPFLNEEKDKKPTATNSAVKTSSLISQRCLEIIYYVIQMSWHSRLYFMTENMQFGQMENGKNKHSFLVLVDLLKLPSFLNNSKLIEQLVEILSKICHSIPNYVEYCKKKVGLENQERAKIELPYKYYECVARVLITNECSSHTFRFTIDILISMSYFDEGFEKIMNSLKALATQSGILIIKELGSVLSILEKLTTGREMETSTLRQFSTATSQQMKLLRILNTLRFLYSKKIIKEGKEDEKGKTNYRMYDGLNLQPLWNTLGSCLKVINGKDELLEVGNVLLPLIECFMTISNDYLCAEILSDQNTLFIKFTEENKKLLNVIVRNSPFLMNGSFACLDHVPMILDFDNKRVHFAEILRKAQNLATRFPALQLSIRREFTFEDTYEQIHELSGANVRYGKLKVHFHDEEGVDEGGVSREWFSTLARQMFDPNYALFITSAADKLTYLPNRSSGVNPDHLSYFKFVGRILGKAIHDGRLLDAYFTRSFYKMILGRPVDYKDMEAIDPTYYKSLEWMLANDIKNVIDLTFSVEVEEFGITKTISLKPDGENIPVTQENKQEYVNLVTSQRLVLAIKPQMDAFLEGFYEIIPYQNIKMFNEQELELLISGLPDIDVDDWKANTEYQGYTFQSPQIQWFWRAVRSFDEEERAKLLQFATGTSKVPLEGFSSLQGSNGLQKFQIHKEFSDINRLPSAHTCFNQIDLPQYKRYEDLRRNLFKAISECSTGFGFV
ncbi:hypothetical protein BY458DRAFT_467864 [Sporodiniella umbellata]|nr:hypothetical protein BY458DRAFT_467864 [Sporodiniella umbellata]